MNSLIVFDDKRCREFSHEAPLSELRIKSDKLDEFDEDLPLARQEQLVQNELFSLGDDKKTSVLLLDAQEQHYSTVGVLPIRIGPGVGSHVLTGQLSGSVALYGDYVQVHDATGVYICGRKAEKGRHFISHGDSIWVGTVKIVESEKYITCTGTDYTSLLNTSTFTPEKYEEYPIYKRSPRIIKRSPTDAVELSSPPRKEEPRKGEILRRVLPALSMVIVTVAVGMMIGRGMFVVASAAAMSVSVVFSVTSVLGDRKTRKEKEARRVLNYEEYLLERREKIHGLYTDFKESLLYHNLAPKDIEREVKAFSSRLYERASNDSDFLTLTLGNSTQNVSFAIKRPSDMDTGDLDPLIDEVKELADAFNEAEEMPTVIDLKQAHLGLVGEKAYVHRQLFSILAQICFFQSYHDIEFVMLIDEADWQKFEWVRWFPHCRNKNINISGLVSAENQRDQILGNIAQVLKMRRQKQAEEKKDSKYLPHYVLIIDSPKLIINHSIMEYLQSPDTSLGVSIIYTTHIRANLPENIKTVFILDGGDNGNLQMSEGNLLNRSVTLHETIGVDFVALSRMLSPLKHSQGVSTQIPDSVSFFELYNIKHPEEILVKDLWERNASYKSLSAPLGFRGKDDIVYLNLHEKAHGPHGLVAGTTGSGKSEIVQSYILSLAVNFHPHEVGFLLIDYKGGGMANLFADLPHLLGTITNLDGSESMRALASIKSELARRQRVFGECGVNNINRYTKMFRDGEVSIPIPHLFIISDEFAELKKEQPDFMSELVSAARIGRSLGVHLILATQKPTGVVDDQIWSNSRFKLALKVAEESDSNEILKTPDAARITQPGRAYLQVGNNEIYELFQSAWSGAPFSEDVVRQGFDKRVYLINRLGQGELLNEDLSEVDEQEESAHTQLDVVVSHIQKQFESLGDDMVDKPWLPPLETKLVTDKITQGVDVGSYDEHRLSVAIGMVDIPEEQCQTVYTHDFLEDGNLGIFGATGFGKSTVIMNTLLQLSSNNSPSLLNFFILDYGNSGLAQLKGLPHTADYLAFDDTEKLGKLEKLFLEELKKRRALFSASSAISFKMYNEIAPNKLPCLILIIDNYDVVREIGGELEEFFVKLTRDGQGVGVYTVITATRSSAVRYSVLNNFKNKIALFMFDDADVTSLIGRTQYKLPQVQGRALVKLSNAHVAQCYLPTSYESDVGYTRNIGEIIAGISALNTAPEAVGVRIVPEKVRYDDLENYLAPDEKKAVIGFDIESTEPVFMDVGGGYVLVVGAPVTGKTNIMKLIATQFIDASLYVADSRTGDLGYMDGQSNVIYMETESQLDSFYDELSKEIDARQQGQLSSGLRAREYFGGQPPAILLLDDGDNFIELCRNKTKEMEALLPKAIESGFCIVVSTQPSKLRGYDNLTKIFRGAQAGIVLGNPVDQNLLNVLPPKGFKSAPDIGFSYIRGDVRQVKLPLMNTDD